MERAEQAETEAEREAAKESKPMYFRLWEHRAKFQATTGRHCQILKTSPVTHLPTGKTWTPDGTWDSILPHLEKLQEREDSICRDAAIAEASPEQEREWLEEHREEISDDECDIIEYLLQLREQMDGDNYCW